MSKCNNFKYIAIMAFLINNPIPAQTFDNIWYEMQSKYINLKSTFAMFPNANKYVTEYWQSTSFGLDQLIQGQPNINFLDNYYLRETMVRTGFGKMQKFEECFLDNCLSDENKKILNNFKDNDQNLLPKESKFNCSVNTLGHLFYALKVAENIDVAPKTIVEFGGGYGNLTNIFKQIYPQSTIIIFDLPEAIALQYLFLKYTNPNIDIIVHDSAIKNNLQKEAIHLIPMYLIDQCDIDTNLFISTFAITESSDYIQNLVINKNFFNASMVYIAGQLNGWRELGLKWMTDHKALVSTIRKDYKRIYCNPFHHFEDNQKSYEMIAIK